MSSSHSVSFSGTLDTSNLFNTNQYVHKSDKLGESISKTSALLACHDNHFRNHLFVSLNNMKINNKRLKDNLNNQSINRSNVYLWLKSLPKQKFTLSLGDIFFKYYLVYLTSKSFSCFQKKFKDNSVSVKSIQIKIGQFNLLSIARTKFKKLFEMTYNFISINAFIIYRLLNVFIIIFEFLSLIKMFYCVDSFSTDFT